MKAEKIRIRDPYILPVEEEETYYLFGTTDSDCWNGAASGFDCYKSRDLINWEGPIPVFKKNNDFWGTKNFWAPEVHRYTGKFYMFASFKAENRYRGTQILFSDSITGPYRPLTDRPVTPENWECLDGTFFIDNQGIPWIIFCHEWVQVHNGAIYALKLTYDLKNSIGKPILLFNATEAGWVKKVIGGNPYSNRLFPDYVTDGPYICQMKNGSLAMLWSSYGIKGYAMGIANSPNGEITGPWIQQKHPLYEEDGGHGMIFQSFDGHKILTFHQPNNSPHERPVFLNITEKGGSFLISHE